MQVRGNKKNKQKKQRGEVQLKEKCRVSRVSPLTVRSLGGGEARPSPVPPCSRPCIPPLVALPAEWRTDTKQQTREEKTRRACRGGMDASRECNPVSFHPKGTGCRWAQRFSCDPPLRLGPLVRARRSLCDLSPWVRIRLRGTGPAVSTSQPNPQLLMEMDQGYLRPPPPKKQRKEKTLVLSVIVYYRVYLTFYTIFPPLETMH
jgi:hypothetical protein